MILQVGVEGNNCRGDRVRKDFMCRRTIEVGNGCSPMPGVQKPHCDPCDDAIASCERETIGCSFTLHTLQLYNSMLQ